MHLMILNLPIGIMILLAIFVDDVMNLSQLNSVKIFIPAVVALNLAFPAVVLVTVIVVHDVVRVDGSVIGRFI